MPTCSLAQSRQETQNPETDFMWPSFPAAGRLWLSQTGWRKQQCVYSRAGVLEEHGEYVWVIGVQMGAQGSPASRSEYIALEIPGVLDGRVSVRSCYMCTAGLVPHGR